MNISVNMTGTYDKKNMRRRRTELSIKPLQLRQKYNQGSMVNLDLFVEFQV